MKNKSSVIGFILLATAFLFSSCSNEIPKQTITNYDTGEIKHIVSYESSKDTTNYIVQWFRKDGTKICEGSKRNFEKEGVWFYFDEKERMTGFETFCGGLLCDTQANYYPTGNIQEVMIFDDSIRSNIDTSCNYTHYYFWENEKINAIGHFKECDLELVIWFDSLSGKMTQKFNYENGQLNGLYENHLKDGAVMQGCYLNGDPRGRWTTTFRDSLISEKIYSQ